MSTNQKLRTVQEQLQEQGVQDVKFYFRLGSLSEQPSSVVEEKVADFLGAYLAKEYEEVNGVGDSVAERHAIPA
jgi:hypothetical protein